MSKPATHYPNAPKSQPIKRHTLAVIVDNEPGVLARIAGLFSGRGYNIESLTVSETEHEAHLSRITVVTRGTPSVLEQIKAQLERIIPVHRVVDLTVRARDLGQERPVEREVALVKVAGTGETRAETLRLAARLAKLPPEALAISRALLRGDRAPMMERMNEELVYFAARLKSAEARKAFEAFLNK